MKPASKVSIIVVTKNRYRQLMSCLFSIGRQTYKNVEIIVVDSSDKPSKPLIPGVLGKSLKYIHNPFYSIPQARQAGIDFSTSLFVMFLDDDCRAEKGWVSAMVELAIKNPRFALLSGGLVHLPKTSIYAQIISDIRDQRYELAGELSWIYFNIENCLFRRSFLIKHKIRFDPALLHEDFADLALQIKKAGGKILLNPKIKVQHLERQSLISFLKQRFKNSGNLTRIRIKWPDQQFHFFASDGTRFFNIFMLRMLNFLKRGEIDSFLKYILIIFLSVLVYKLGNLYYRLLYSRVLNQNYLRSRPYIDFVLAVVMFIATFPLMIIIGIIIRLDSKGPILFSQIRLGENKKRFLFYKFRTMLVDAKSKFPNLYEYRLDQEEIVNFRFKTLDDPRLTRFGKYLRKTSLDELPNLINIIRGEMSLIGPRPEIPEMLQNYTKEEMIKFSVKPGVTGMAQVMGRGLLKFKETIKFDCNYARNPSLMIDIEIIFRTIYVVIRGLGAF